MKIDVKTQGGTTIVLPTGQFVGPDAGLMSIIMPLIEQPGGSVVLDLSGVDYVSSAGLGELVRITAQANAQRARVVLAAPSPFVMGVLETTRLNKFFDVAQSVDDALKKLAH